MVQPTTLTIGQAAARIGVTPDVVRTLADNGHLRCLKLPSRHRRFFADDIDRFIAERTIERAS